MNETHAITHTTSWIWIRSWKHSTLRMSPSPLILSSALGTPWRIQLVSSQSFCPTMNLSKFSLPLYFSWFWLGLGPCTMHTTMPGWCKCTCIFKISFASYENKLCIPASRIFCGIFTHVHTRVTTQATLGRFYDRAPQRKICGDHLLTHCKAHLGKSEADGSTNRQILVWQVRLER